MYPEKIPEIEALLEWGRREGVYPGAVLLAAHGGMIRLFMAVGDHTLLPHALPMEKDTPFDLASLTKPLATTLAMMKLVDAGEIALEEPLEKLLHQKVPEDKKRITPRLLLSHSAGFTDWMPFYLDLGHVPPKERKPLLRNQLLTLPLSYSPGTGSLYSDLGFMLLEWVIEARAGMDLPRLLEQGFYTPLSFKDTGLFSAKLPVPGDRDRFAATEDCSWRKQIIQGTVHDENAYFLGGYSGHAGLFGTAEEIYKLANLLRGHWRGERNDYLRQETVRGFFTRQDLVVGSTWALGWDTPSAAYSSAGRHFTSTSVGHLGFTGTSLWMDMEQDVIVILLTNRIHPTRKNEKIRAFRPVLHDRIMEVFGRTH